MMYDVFMMYDVGPHANPARATGASPRVTYHRQVFGRRSSAPRDASPEADATADEGEFPEAQRPKGRPTPSRKEALAQRKQTLRVPADPKAAKRAMRDRDRQARAEARAGLMAGDPRYLPPRDQGAAKAFTRDFIDGRRRLSEYFIFVAVAILLVSFIRVPSIVAALSIGWLVIAGLVIIEAIWVGYTLSRALKEKWPEPQDRKGCILYAMLRLLQIRRLRVPPPRIKPGGEVIKRTPAGPKA